MVRPSRPSAEHRAHLERGLAKRAETWTPVTGGFSSAGIWTVTLEGGGKVFVKAATNDLTAAWLRDEHLIYTGVTGPFMPELVLWDAELPLPMLVIEDLSGAHWPPPWSAEQIEQVLATLEDVAAATCPPGLCSAEDHREAFSGWARIARDPAAATSTGLFDAGWLDEHLDDLVRWEAAMPMQGSSLLHFDVRSDNLCFAPSVKLVDWNHACRGSATLDVLGWLPSLYVEGGPAPWDVPVVVADDAPSIVTAFAGYFAAQASTPIPEHVREDIRDFQRTLGKVCLEWTARLLGIAPPG